MSDYRRFIAYLYEYPNNRKGGCCGFVRVESQNGFCRMDFQIKSPSLPPETSVTVYGFIRRSGRMYGIPLGNLLAGRSSTSGKLFTHSDAIGQTDVTLDELGGLILALPPDRRHRHPVGRSSDSAGSFSLPRSRRSPKHPQTMVPDRPKRKLPKHPNLWIPPYLRSPCHHQTLPKHSSMNFPQNSAAIPNFIHKIPARNPPSPQNPHQLTR